MYRRVMRLTLVRLGGGWWWRDSLIQFIVDKNRCSRRIVVHESIIQACCRLPHPDLYCMDIFRADEVSYYCLQLKDTIPILASQVWNLILQVNRLYSLTLRPLI